MRLSSHVDPRRRRIGLNLGLDRLEDRTLLSGGTRFAVYQGQLTTQSSDAFTVQIDRHGFRPARGNQVLLRIDSRASGGTLDPGAVDLDSTGPRAVRVVSERDDAGSGTDGITVAAAGPGALTIRPTAEGGTQGGYEVGVSLAGDVNGDYRVDRADLFAIRSAIGRTPGSTSAPEAADVDGDGAINLRDWSLAFRNLGAATSIRPLDLTAKVDPSDDPDGDRTVDEDVAETDLIGTAAPGSTIRLDVGGDGTFDATTTAAADGSYRFAVPLNLGVNPFAIQARGPDGQVASTSLSVTRGPVADAVTRSYDFAQGAQGWTADFADLPVDPNDTYELDSGIRDLPSELDGDGTGYLLQSHNRSDDVFMFLTRKLTSADGIVAGQEYQVEFTLKFASNAPSGGVGAGGAPGEAVVLKAGASTIEPTTVVQNGYDRLNVDKGNNSEGGTAASVAGNIANGLQPQDGQASVPYVSLSREHTHTATVKADAQGNLWLIVGTDSGYEGITAVYFQSIAVTLTPVTT
ncbi:dockerin type I repeat-containing protein [Paludisphaera mucosa]|uniref:Dockerin type I repeat-containing protein n=1 Tax=Paludisphaera mucosa TaxID=3030827 RepID=A0ABT6FJF8_9BACT|nr:dockerin type I repeat-containing protein [Paludisphaera mucosa]MDG3007669.1 dockerin type I repeat-containing protein [Paludisphaera mucosa]